MSELIRFILSALFMAVGIAAILLSVLGVFKFRFVMNRMHCAAIVDTLGALCVLLSLAIAPGSGADGIKLAVILVLVWVGSPLSSHLLARMEISTDPEAIDHVKLKKSEVEKDA